MKICSLYGAGFYYIPGTDTCIKLGGFVRAEINVNTASGSFVQHTSVNFDDRATSWTHWRARGIISLDARTQTSYGTLRAYWNGGPTVTDVAVGTGTPIFHNRAFIQWAGFTGGNAVSFFDFDPISSYSNQTNRIGSSVGGTGIPLFAYTAQFGNGFSASISAESTGQRRTAILSTGGGGGYGGFRWPDAVANLRIDQAWGSAQVMGAVHEIYPDYYTAANTSGNPGNKVGYAIGGGIKLNLPMLGKGDFVIAQVNYTRGALRYVGSGLATYNIRTGIGSAGDPVLAAYGPVFDGTYGLAGDVELTKGWSVTGGFQHNWVPGWKSSIYGAYAAINYDAASDARILAAGGPGGGAAVLTSGTADWSIFQVGTRTVWTPVPNLDLSLEAMYQRVNTAFDSTPGYEDKGWWSGIFRAQRNFYP